MAPQQPEVKARHQRHLQIRMNCLLVVYSIRVPLSTLILQHTKFRRTSRSDRATEEHQRAADSTA